MILGCSKWEHKRDDGSVYVPAGLLELECEKCHETIVALKSEYDRAVETADELGNGLHTMCHECTTSQLIEDGKILEGKK